MVVEGDEKEFGCVLQDWVKDKNDFSSHST